MQRSDKMKKVFTGIIITMMMTGAVALANPKINKAHKGKTGKDGAKINCNYCHKTAAIPKTKGQDAAKIQKGASCATAGCHK